MAAKLVVEEGDLKGLILPLEQGDTWVIGRDPEECQLVIEDPLVSNKHLIVRRTPQGIVIENLSLNNPALVNEEELAQSHLLQQGDTIRIAGELLSFYEDEPAQIIKDEDMEDELSQEFDLEEPTEISDISDLELFDEIESESDPASNREPIPQPPIPEERNESEEESEDETFGDTEEENEETEEEQEEEPAEKEEGEAEMETESLPVEEAEEEVGEDEEELESEILPEHHQPIPELLPEAIPESLPEAEKAEQPSEPPLPEPEEGAPHHTVFEENEIEMAELAEINFGMVETGRWLLKVVGGPNNGAEFYMQSGQSYILGTDTNNCDIVFHDTSVSRQHAKITITPEETLIIEDLKSRNGVLINGIPLEGQGGLDPSSIVTLGTTSFAVYDREGDMQTIISPLLPSIVKVLQQEEPPQVEPIGTPPEPSAEEKVKQEIPPEQVTEPVPPPKPAHNFGQLLVLAAVIGLFALVGIGITTLFRAETVTVQVQENANELLQQALKPFPAIKFSFNKANGGLLLLGHVTTQAEKNQLLYNLQGLKFIKSTDDSGIIIDELVWHEVNSILSENPAWKGITIHSPAAGQFVLSGYLRTRKQAEQLSAYISLNFPYLDLLRKEVVIEEDVINQINAWTQEDDLESVTTTMANGEVTLTGSTTTENSAKIGQLITKIKQIPGVRVVNNQIKIQASEKVGIINLSSYYEVTGKSKIKDKYTVVVNGRILSEGDNLDGMDVTKITANTILLEKEGKKYRIDY